MKTLHPTLHELTRIGYGFDPSPEHVEYCVECLETLRRLRLEREQLREKPSQVDRGAPLSRFVRRFLSAGSRTS
jgi:hypothetical protein